MVAVIFLSKPFAYLILTAVSSGKDNQMHFIHMETDSEGETAGSQFQASSLTSPPMLCSHPCFPPACYSSHSYAK